MLNVVLAGLHSLVSVQVLVFSAIITPNQDLAFVLAVSYTCICTFLGGYFVHIDSLVSSAAALHGSRLFALTQMLQQSVEYLLASGHPTGQAIYILSESSD